MAEQSTNRVAAPDVLEPVSLCIDPDVVQRYGVVSQDFNPIHFDDEAARAMGLPKAIAHGMIAGGLVSKLLARNLGAEWMGRGRLALKFVRPTLVGQTVTARGTVRSRDPLVIDVVVENEDGQPVIVGDVRPPT